MNKLFDVIIRKYKYIMVAIVLLSLPMGYYFTQYKFFNHIDIFFDASDPNLQFYKNFQKRYGNEELGVILFKAPDGTVFNERVITVIRSISAQLKEADGVQRVFSLTEAKEAQAEGNTIRFVNIIPKGEIAPTAYDPLKHKVLKNPVVVNSLVSKDGATTAILFELKPTSDNEKKRELLQRIMAFSLKAAGDAVRLHFAGVPYVEVEMNILSKRDFLVFTPITFFLIFIVVAFMLKRISLALLCQMNLLLTLVWAIGFFSMMGESFNMVTVIMGAILLAIAVADSIHILAHYREADAYHDNHDDAIRHTLKSIWMPCLLTSLTTAVGFFSFLTSTIRPVKVLGLYAGIGVLIAYLVTLTFIPVMLIMLKGGANGRSAAPAADPFAVRESSRFMKALDRMSDFTLARYRFVFVGLIIILALTVAGALRIKFETNTMNYLPDDNRIKTDINFIEEQFAGTIPFVMLVQAKSPEYDFTHPESLRLVDTIQRDMMKAITHYSTSFSLSDYFKEIHQAFNDGDERFRAIPDNRRDIVDYYELADSEVIDRIVSPDRMETRLSFQSKWGSNETAKEYHNYIVGYMDKAIGEHYTYKITGLSSMYLNMEFNLKESQIKSILTSFVLIFVMMYFVCGTFWLTVISMVANVFPIVVTLGIMGWFGIPLDVSTIMVASVTIGIAVDDTIHIVTWLRRHAGSGEKLPDAIRKTYRDVGKPVIITSLVLFFGFMILILGSIKPTQAFGMLTAFSMLFALIGDLFILPALILVFKPKIAG